MLEITHQLATANTLSLTSYAFNTIKCELHAMHAFINITST